MDRRLRRFAGQNLAEDELFLLKERTLREREKSFMEVLQEFESSGKIGEVVFDIGSGSIPLSMRYFKNRHKIITIDKLGEEVREPDHQHVRLDIEEINDLRNSRVQNAFRKILKFLEIKRGQLTTKELIDTVIISDLLNYVDYRQVIMNMAQYVKPRGRMIIFHMPFRGNMKLRFSKRRLRQNTRLFELFATLGFEIEHKSFPWRYPGLENEKKDLVILVARKSGEASK